jgi:DNA-binding transcriptional ArsR family regulator
MAASTPTTRTASPSAPDRLTVLRRPEQAAALMHPIRRRILGRLREPDSAAGVARALDLPRQKVNYHVRLLEKDGLVEEVDRRPAGNCVERVVRATATHWLIGPQVLGDLEARPEDVPDRFSSGYLVALAARTIREVADLRRHADDAGLKLPTLSMDGEVRFASAEDQNAFATELADAVTRLVARFHDDGAPRGRSFRLVVGSHPLPTPAEDPTTPRSETGEDPP